jgi:GTPase SAR1 family protein
MDGQASGFWRLPSACHDGLFYRRRLDSLDHLSSSASSSAHITATSRDPNHRIERAGRAAEFESSLQPSKMAPPPSFVAPTVDQIRRTSSPVPIANGQTLAAMVSPQPLDSSQLQALGSTRSKRKNRAGHGLKDAGANKSSPPTAGKPVFQFGAARCASAISNAEKSDAETNGAEQKKLELQEESEGEDEKDTDGEDEVANIFALATKGTELTPVARSDLTSFESLTKEHIRPLIELNDRMNRLLTRESKINPTSIVVAGDQSHGKTSLLEALSGVDLPRGEGIQTRVPLVLQLRSATFEEHAIIRIQPGRGSEEKAATEASKHSDGERISLEDIADKVREYTNVAAGAGKDIKDRPIELKVFRNNQDDLTLIDLPGITRVALKGQAGGDDKELENIITSMYEKYLEPEETIILNVASAQMDICTSQSVQISRKLDKMGNRTMLCITKVDEHANASRLNKAIESDIATLGLNPANVFAVRNRSQDENDQGISLDEVRKAEKQHLAILAREREGNGGLCVRYGLGVEDLSKRLVSVQRDQILQTLPNVRKAIKEKTNELQSKLDKLGKPVGDAKACRAKVLHCIEASVIELQNEMLGRSPQRTVSEDELKAGAMFEISLTIDNFSDMRGKKWEKNEDICQKKRVGGFDFELSVYPLYKDPDDVEKSDKEDKSDVPSCVGGFLSVQPSEDIEVKSMVITFSITGTGSGGSSQMEIESKEYAEQIEDGSGWGTSSLLSQKVADSIRGQATFTANVFVEKIEIERSASAEVENQDLLCATLNNLQEELVTSIDTLYSNHYFFSSAFRLKLAHEVSSCRGGIGLPGTIAPHVPVNILKHLRQKLPEVIEAYRNQVKTACTQKVKASINNHFEEKIHPNLNRLVLETSKELLEKMATNLIAHHALILEWEDSICSSNHYFMDTVQSIRSSLLDDESDRPAYLKHLSDKMIKKMSNEDQRIVDMQIEIFAYWKLMKKRLVDYVIMSTQSELVSKPFSTMLKPTLMEVTMAQGDDEIIRLLDSDPQIVKERRNAMDRLDLLQEAQEELEKHDQKMSLFFC